MIEKSLLMNDYSDRAEKWRNFNQFVIKILEEDDIKYPISKQQSDIYYELAKHEMSVIQKQTNNVGGFAITPSDSDYAQFISEFDIVFEGIVQRFNSKLPLMDREQ
jgi:nucleosome binding factor SPN SPT16 subunit